jgi:hypothetical protein
MEYLIAGILRLTQLLWDADERPEARRFTLGCGAVLIVAAVVGWWIWLR